MAHGGDGILFFQWRASRAGAEKYHGAMVGHNGDGNDRVFREIRQLGNELKQLSDVVGSRIYSEVAILFDWHNWWALEIDSKPNCQVRYLEQIMDYYKLFFKENISVDFVQPTADLSSYQLVIAPVLYMIEPGVAEKLEGFVAGGGTFVATFHSGLVDENDRIYLGGYPAPLKKILGIGVEEFDALPAGRTNGILACGQGDLTGKYECSTWADVITLEGAKAIAVFTDDFYAGLPAVTINDFGKGRAVYVGTKASEEYNRKLIKGLLADLKIAAPIAAPEGVEVTCRGEYLFILNHNRDTAYVELPAGKYRDLIGGNYYEGVLALPACDVVILQMCYQRTCSNSQNDLVC